MASKLVPFNNLYSGIGSGYIFVMAKERSNYKSKGAQEVGALTYREFLESVRKEIMGYQKDQRVPRPNGEAGPGTFLDNGLKEAEAFEDKHKTNLEVLISALQILIEKKDALGKNSKIATTSEKINANKLMAEFYDATIVELVNRFNEIRTIDQEVLDVIYAEGGWMRDTNVDTLKKYSILNANISTGLKSLFLILCEKPEFAQVLQQVGLNINDSIVKKMQEYAKSGPSTKMMKTRAGKGKTENMLVETVGLGSENVGAIDEILKAVGMTVLLNNDLWKIHLTGDDAIKMLSVQDKKSGNKVTITAKDNGSFEIDKLTATRKADLIANFGYIEGTTKGYNYPISLKNYANSKQAVTIQNAISMAELQNLLLHVYTNMELINKIMSGLLSYQTMRFTRMIKFSAPNANMNKQLEAYGLRGSFLSKSKDQSNNAQSLSSKAYVRDFLSLVFSDTIAYFLGSSDLYKDMLGKDYDNLTKNKNGKTTADKMSAGEDTIRIFGFNRGIYLRSTMLKALQKMQTESRNDRRAIDSRFGFSGKVDDSELMLYDTSIGLSFLLSNEDFIKGSREEGGGNFSPDGVYEHMLKKVGNTSVKGEKIGNRYSRINAGTTIEDIDTQGLVQAMYRQVFNIVKITPKIKLQYEILNKKQKF